MNKSKKRKSFKKRRVNNKRRQAKKKKQPAKETNKKNLWEWLFILIFVLAAGIGYFWTQKHYYSESETVKAVITNTNWRYNGGYSHILEVEYQYTIGGRTYTGTDNTYQKEHYVGDTIEVEVSKKYNDVSQLLF